MANNSRTRVLETFNARSSNYNNESSWVHDNQVIAPLVNPIINNVTKAGNMLDVCSGTCMVALHGLAKGLDVVASDINLEMLRKCPRQDLSRVVCDTTKLPFRDRTFELVTLRQGLHYLELKQTLNELKRVSNSYVSLGHITLQNPEDEGWWRKYFSIASPGRKHIFRPNEIKSLVEQNGMKVVREEVVFTHDRFKGPILHLKEDDVEKLIALMRNSPASFREQYKVTPLGEDDYEYSHRWEFIIASV